MLYDGKRPARKEQILIDAEVKSLFQQGYQVVGLNLPCGYGKSYLARAWQREIGSTDIITCSNHLIDQYQRDYPELNAVKGKDNYATPKEYEDAKSIARTQTPSIFNPLSALFTSPRTLRQIKCVIVDEAHTLGEMLRSAASIAIPVSRANLHGQVFSEYHLARWVSKRFHELEDRMRYAPLTKDLQRQYEQVAAIYYAVIGHEQDSIFHIRRRRMTLKGRLMEKLEVDAVDYPSGLIDAVLGAGQVILMSGTLSKFEVERLANGRKWAWISRPYLSPPENRPVFVQPVDQEDRKNIAKLSDQIRRIYIEQGRKPTLVHVTYEMSHKFKEFLHDLSPLTNSPANKADIEQQFRRDGGLWLASGCAEGIDLADDACRAVIIPIIQFPNKGDMYVQKRMSRPDGNRWYNIKALENTIQRIGRGLRNPTDYCHHFILDPYFPRLYTEYGSEFEPLEIKWGT
jgi:Rad3-related DNA helicase